MTSKQALAIVGLLVVAGITFVAFRTLNTPNRGVEGAIGAAQRYTTEQISDQDVAVESPQVQAFLQSDVFHKLATNATFRRTVLNKTTVNQLRSFYQKSNPSVLSSEGEVVAELMDEAEVLKAAAADRMFQKAVASQRVQAAAAEMLKSYKALSQGGGVDAEMLAKARKLLQDEGVAELEQRIKLFDNEAFLEALAKGKAQELMENGELLELLSDDGLAEMFHDQDLQSVLMRDDVAEAFRTASADLWAKAVASRARQQE